MGNRPSDPRPTGLFAGLATLDTVYRVVDFPPPNGKITALAQDLGGGGPAANAAVTYAALGGTATLLTALGRHPLAELVAAELASRGVGVRDATPSAGTAPAVSSVYVRARDGQRNVVSVNAQGIRAEPPSDVDELVSTADVVLVDGHHPALALAAARAARQHGVPVVLDAGSWKDVLPELLPLVDLAVCSADLRVPGHDDALAGLRALGVPAGAITHGADPVHWWSGPARGVVPVPRIRAVDTLGAGDVFHGALARAVAADRRAAEPGRLPAVLAFAAEAAALRCATPGPRAWLDRPELAALAGRLPTPS
jgi:sugar/nucleoside kinase (ribokinase family)